MYDLVMAEATAYYEKREAELGAAVMREVERQVMLRIIDQRWREHLYEMDYLQEGINLRAWARRTRSSSGSARATRCSAR